MVLNLTPEISQGCQDMSTQKRSILLQFFTFMPTLEGLVGFLTLKVDNQAGVIAEAIPNLVFSKRDTYFGIYLPTLRILALPYILYCRQLFWLIKRRKAYIILKWAHIPQ